jgi:hypothetical protein
VTKAVQGRGPAAAKTSAHPSKPFPPKGAVKASLPHAAVALFVVLVAVIYFNSSKGERDRSDQQAAGLRKAGTSEDAGVTDRAAQRAAIRKLRDRKVLVIEEACDPGAPTEKQVTSINFCGTMSFGDENIPDDLLAQLRHFPELQSLNLGDCKITGGQLKYLAGLNRMASLVLSHTAVDDSGLENISLLEAIESLNLRNTAISDAGLGHIAELRNLKVLDLSKTKVTDAGIKKLRPLRDLKWLLLAETALTDAGLDQLASLGSLGRLTINQTDVTKEGIARLKGAIPRLAVDCDLYNPVP